MISVSRIFAGVALLCFTSAALAQEPPPAGAPVAAPAAASKAPEPSPSATADAGAAKVEKKEKAQDAIPESVLAMLGSSTGAKRKSPFAISVVLEQVLGIGTFVSDSFARNPYYGYSLVLRPRYYFTDKLFAELQFGISGELTTSNQTSTTYKRQVMPSDLSLTLKYSNAAKIPVINVTFAPFIRLAAPTSYESRYRNLYLSSAAGFNLGGMYGGHFIIDYMFRFNKNWNKTAQPTISGGQIALSRVRGAEDIGGGEVINGDDNNTSFSVYNALTGSFIINEQWSITLQLAIQNSWTYLSIPKDQFASPYAKAGRGQRDKTFGVIDVSYQPWEHFGFSLGLSSAQPAKTADNKSVRFPFFDFSSEGNNYTQIYFDVFMTY
jgi:hypothetical protein